MENEEGLVVRGRMEIDMRQPFRSVKEAISLFGEKVLAGEIYATKFKETKSEANQQQKPQLNFGTTTTVLEGTKEKINKANEEGNLMAFYLNSLKHELEATKKEPRQLKKRGKSQELTIMNPEIEELKFVENTTKVEAKTQTEDEGPVLQKKRSVKFASPPLLTRVIVNKDAEEKEAADLPSPSFTKKRKPLIPLFGALFSKKKAAQKIKSKSFKI